MIHTTLTRQSPHDQLPVMEYLQTDPSRFNQVARRLTARVVYYIDRNLDPTVWKDRAVKTVAASTLLLAGLSTVTLLGYYDPGAVEGPGATTGAGTSGVTYPEGAPMTTSEESQLQATPHILEYGWGMAGASIASAALIAVGIARRRTPDALAGHDEPGVTL
jgi:hypothetical protein